MMKKKKLVAVMCAVALIGTLMGGMPPGGGGIFDTLVTANASNSNEGWTDCYPEDGQYVLVCKSDPSKVLTYYGYNYQFSTYTGDDSQKWSIERVPDQKYYRITFDEDDAMDVPCWENDMNYGDNLSTVSYSTFGNFNEHETNVFRFSQRDGGPGGEEYAIRIVSEAANKWDYVLQGYVTADSNALKVGQYDDNNTSQYWSFIAVDDYKEHTHHFTYAASGNTVTATCDNDEGYCFLANRQSVLKITPPSNLAQGGSSSDADKQAQLTGKDGKVFTDSNTSAISYYAATLNDTTYTKKGSALASTPTVAGDYVAEVTVTVDGQKYTASVGYTLLDLTVIGTSTDTNNYLPTYSFYDYSWSQQIYTAAEIGKSGNILAVDFYNAGEERTRKLEVYMIETDKDSFSDNNDWVSICSDNKVFSGNVKFTPNVWTSITLDTPFEYDGTKNLLMCVRDMTGLWEYGLECQVSSASNKAIYVYRDNDPYDISNPGTEGTVLEVRNNIRLAIVELAQIHEHSFDYTVDGDTITASCSGRGDCDINEGLTLTISAPTDLEADGNPKEATLTTDYNTTAFPDTYTIEYYQGTTKLDVAPTDAGSYIAKVTVGTVTASVDFTITQVDPVYIVTIPETVTLDADGKATATIEIYGEDENSDVILPNGKKVNVALTKSDNGFNIKNDDGDTISYTVNNSNSADELHNVADCAEGKVSKDITFAKTGETIYSGTYTDTLTFTVSLEDA